MKEIDFIPQWYKAGRKRKVEYRRQYAVIVGLFIGLILWSFAAGYGVALSQAHVERIKERLAEKIPITAEYTQLENQRKSLEDKKQILEQLDQNANFSSILAEISFLTSNNILLNCISIETQPFQSGMSSNTSYIRVGNSNASSKTILPEDNLCLGVTITGIAVNANEVAALIAELDQSPYFCNVVPGYSRSKTIKESVATEFEIKCNVANYIVKKAEDKK